MKERIKEKIEEIEKYLEELEEIKPNTLEQYFIDFKARAACERYIEKIIEAVTDLGIMVIKDKSLIAPESDLDVFSILLENKTIENDLCTNLKNAKRMRNIIAHEYGEVDNEIVFNSIEELFKDVNNFLSILKREYFTGEGEDEIQNT